MASPSITMQQYLEGSGFPLRRRDLQAEAAQRYGAPSGDPLRHWATRAGRPWVTAAGRRPEGSSRGCPSGVAQRLGRARAEVDDAVRAAGPQHVADLVAADGGARNRHQGLSRSEPLVVDGQDVLVVAQVLQGPHELGAESVLGSRDVQDASPFLAVEDPRVLGVEAGRLQVAQSGLHGPPVGE